jgi:hypothetical protein
MIKRIGGKYYVYNENGTKKLSKGYSKKADAIQRLTQIEHFKKTKGRKRK